MALDSIIFVLFGSTLGLILRIILSNNLKFKAGFYINHISLVNFLASFFLGIFLALNPISKNLLFLFYVGFLGCFSTFSSFIYQLFMLFKRRKYVILILHYIEVLILSFLFFYLGYYLIQFN